MVGKSDELMIWPLRRGHHRGDGAVITPVVALAIGRELGFYRHGAHQKGND
jgi:hypothetical protein